MSSYIITEAADSMIHVSERCITCPYIKRSRFEAANARITGVILILICFLWLTMSFLMLYSFTTRHKCNEKDQ